ncbi:MAG: hypothetical protein JST18_10425 [Bacteroidetes bacterium]|nr:hypothetical protein [Bacteroidota bacterium]
MAKLVHSVPEPHFNHLEEKVKEEKVSGNEVTMDASELPAGLYVVRSSERVIGKFLKE